MTELDFLRSRAEQATSWPQTVPEGASLVRQAAERRHRRRRGLQVAAAVMVVGAIAAVPLAVRGLDANPPGDRVAGPVSTDGLGVAPGYRPVGVFGLVFEVPDSWGSEQLACDGSPTADTVAFGSGRDCLVLDPPRVSSLIIANRTDSRVADVLDRVDAVPGRYGSVTVEVSAPVRLEGLWTFMVDGGGEKVAVFRSVEAAPAQHAHEHLREVPEGWAAIPEPGLDAEQYRARLVDLGLDVRVIEVDHPDFPSGTMVGLSPDKGAVLRVGESVEISVVR